MQEYPHISVLLIQVSDRQSWRSTLENRLYEIVDNETKENGAMKLEDMDMENDQNNKDRLENCNN